MALFCFMTTVAQPAAGPDVALVPETYSFTWAYDLSVELDGQKLEMTYHIEPGATYYGYSMKVLPGILSVTDVGRDLTFKTFGKTAKLSTLDQKPDKKQNVTTHRYTRLPDKMILGYKCIGLKAETDSEEATIYFTNEAEASYPELYKQLRVHHLVISLADYGFTDKSLLMISDVKLKKKDGHAIITCTRFEKEPMVFSKSDYSWTAH